MLINPEMLINKAIEGDIVNIDNVFTIKKSYYVDFDVETERDCIIIRFVTAENFSTDWFYEDSDTRDAAYNELKSLLCRVD